MQARYPSLQVRSDNEEALRRVLKDACEQVHLRVQSTHIWKLLHPIVEVKIVFEP